MCTICKYLDCLRFRNCNRGIYQQEQEGPTTLKPQINLPMPLDLNYTPKRSQEQANCWKSGPGG